MPKAILFDLDGTLLPVDTNKFVENYIQELIPFIKDYYDPQKFVGFLLDSTNEMMKNNNPNFTNQEIFTKHFFEKSKLDEALIWPVFEDFYESHFPKLKKYTEPTNHSKKIVEIAKSQGRKVIIATNPVFPKLAIYERLRWLDLNEQEFELVTGYEDSHFCKPQINFFQEVLDKVGIQADEAIMVGNDVQEDMIASQLGMNTYLVTDYLIDRGNPMYSIDQEGTLEELKEHLYMRKGIFKL